MATDNQYPTQCVRREGSATGRCLDWCRENIVGRYLDCGCNVGALLAEVPNGIGVDLAASALEAARARGCEVYHADMGALPFPDQSFDTVVFCRALNQVPNPADAIREGLRVGRRIIGINPIPGTAWGVVGGWTQSVVPETLMHKYGCETGQLDDHHYWFRTTKEWTST